MNNSRRAKWIVGVGVLLVAAASTPLIGADGPEPPPKLARPTPEQVAWHDSEIGMFIHFAPNTWFDKEYDDLSLPLEKFDPTHLDTDAWVAAAEAMTARYIVFVAKHVGGFCMWPTETTDYSVKSTPWRGGEGDVMKDLAESCRKRGIKLGVYLSPADRKHGAGVGGRCKNQADQERYNKLYRRQLVELLTRYGEMFEVWFDGSNVVEVGDILAEHAPRAMVFQGPHATIRWVGNEAGHAPYPAWNSLSQADADGGVATARHGDPDGAAWMPNECDARIRSTWFWNRNNAPTLKTVEQLMEMYDRSVGRGAVLLLNHTPDPTGRIPDSDVKRGAEFGAEIKRRYGKSIAETAGRGKRLDLKLPAKTVIDHVITAEDIRQGERIREYVVEGRTGDTWRELCRGTAVGHKRIDRFDPVEVSAIRLLVLEAAAEPLIRTLAAYSIFGKLEPTEPPSPTPIAYWRFDKSEGGKIRDASGRHRSGRLVRADLAPGKLGQALRLGGTDGFVDVPDLEPFAGDFTIAGWINPAPDGKGNRIIISKETCNVGAHQCRFYLTGDNRLGFMMSDARGPGIWPFQPAEPKVPARAWSHVAVTCKGTAFTLYLDGKKIGEKRADAPIRHRNRDSVKIGGVLTQGTQRIVQPFHGLIDELRIYNRPLPPSELESLAEGRASDTAHPARPAWIWTPERITTDWQTVKIDVSAFCPEAGQYEVTFRRTGGKHDLQVESLTLLMGDREAPELVEPAKRPHTFHVTVPGVDVPRRLRAVLRSQGGTDTQGVVEVRKLDENRNG